MAGGRARADATDYIARHGRAHGLEPTASGSKAHKRLWGSCTGKGAINLNWRRIPAPPTVVEYVVVHESAIRRAPPSGGVLASGRRRPAAIRSPAAGRGPARPPAHAAPGLSLTDLASGQPADPTGDAWSASCHRYLTHRRALGAPWCFVRSRWRVVSAMPMQAPLYSTPPSDHELPRDRPHRRSL